jgi:4-hydroxy-tetrahydrodipicolinate synthase
MVIAAGVEAQEYTYLDLDGRKALLKLTVDMVAGRCPVLAGISHPSFQTAVELALFAEESGARIVQLLAPLRPFGGPPTDRDLVAYFDAIARETTLPIALYLNAGPGADVSVPATLARVSRLIVEIDRTGLARYFTTMQMLLATLQLGGSGATMPPPGAEIARHVIDAFLAGDHVRAAEIQLQFALFPARWMHRGLTPTMKAAMGMIGVPVGEMYPPYTSLDSEEAKALRAHLRTTVLSGRLSRNADH